MSNIMELTGKCEEVFNKWFEDKYDNNKTSNVIMLQTEFDSMPFEFKYSVYIDFFDSVGFNIVIEQLDYQSWYNYRITNLVLLQFKGTKLSCRPKTRLLAIKKANELYNELY